MSTSPIQEETVSFDIFELTRFNHMINPNSRTIFGWNVYKLILISFNIVIQILTIIGCLGIFFNRDYSINYTNYFLYIYSMLYIFLSFCKFSIILKNSIFIWEVIDVTKITFFKSEYCCKNIQILYEYRKITLKIANLFLTFTCVLSNFWSICPLMINSFSSNALNNRMPNIMNFPFPVKIQTYNQYYTVFYITELFISNISSFNVVIVHAFFIIISQVIVAHYKVIAQSYRDIGYEDKTQTGKTNQNELST